MIFRNGAIAALAPLLVGNTYKVQMPTLKCLAMLMFENLLFAYAKTKTQISFAVTAKLISAFVFAT